MEFLNNELLEIQEFQGLVKYNRWPENRLYDPPYHGPETVGSLQEIDQSSNNSKTVNSSRTSVVVDHFFSVLKFKNAIAILRQIKSPPSKTLII
jgi:hypothetical protein